VCGARRLDVAGADARREQRAKSYIGAGIGSLILITVLGVGWKNGWNFCAPMTDQKRVRCKVDHYLVQNPRLTLINLVA
jgi:hypothetical protein